MYKTLTLSLVSSLIGTAWAQDAAEAEAAPETDANEMTTVVEDGAAAGEAVAAETTEAEVVVDPQIPVTIDLVSGVRLQGTTAQSNLISWSPGQAIEFTPDGGVQTQLSGDIVASIGAVSAAPAPAPAPTVQPVTIATSSVTDSGYRSPDGYHTPNPATSRYLYAPSSIPLQQGQGYVSQKTIFTSVAYAVNDNFTMLYGCFTFFPPALSVFGAKLGGEVADNIYLSAGAEVFVLGLAQEIPAAIGFGAITFGDEDKHLTIASGYAGGDMFDNNAIPLMIGGQARLSEYAAFVTENWLVYTLPETRNYGVGTDTLFVGSVALRLIGRRDRIGGGYRSMRTQDGHPKTTWDLGLLALGYVEDNGYSQAFFPIPWIDWSWHFGPSGI